MADDEIDNSSDPSDVESPLDGPPTEALQIVEATPVEPMEPVDVQPAVIEPTTVMDAMPADVTPSPTPTGLTPERKRLAIIGGAVAAVLLIVIIVVAGGGDDEKSVTPGSSTTTEVDGTATSITEPADATSTTAVAETTTPATGATVAPPARPAADGPYPPLQRVSASTVIYSPDGRAILTSGQALNPDGPPAPAVLRNASTGDVITTYGTTQTRGEAFSRDGSKVLTSDYGTNTLTVWPVGGGAGVTISAASPRSIGFSPDGSKLVAVSGGLVNVWNVTSGALVTTFAPNAVSAVFSPDGTQVLTTGGSGTADPALWNATTGELVRTYIGAGTPETALFSPDGSKVLATGRFGTASTFDTASGDPLFTITGIGIDSPVAAFSPDSATIVTCGADGTLTRWNSSTGELVATLSAPADLVSGSQISATSIVFSADGSKLAATLQGDGFYAVTIVWNVATGERLIHVTDLHTPTFSPDGTRVAGVADAANSVYTYAV